MSRYIRATVALTSAIAGAVLFAAPAFAAPGDVPVSGDLRATAHARNAVEKDCPTLYPGSHAVTGALTAKADGEGKNGTYLDITAVAGGVEVLGVIVKGGDAYNRYDVAKLGVLPWLDLHSPLNPNGKPAAISHWFACGTGGSTTTTTTTTGTETTTTTTGTETTTTTTDSSSSSATTTTTTGGTGSESSSTGVTTTTTPAGVAPVADEDDLASTGFNGGWLVALAAALLLAGGAVLLLLRTRARS